MFCEVKENFLFRCFSVMKSIGSHIRWLFSLYISRPMLRQRRHTHFLLYFYAMAFTLNDASFKRRYVLIIIIADITAVRISDTGIE